MSSNDETIHKLEMDISDAKYLVKMMEDLKTLTNNSAFKAIIREGYFKENAVRLVNLRADPNMQSEKDQAATLREIDAIGIFRQYLSTINQMGTTALRSLESDERTLEECLAEDLASDGTANV